MREGWNRATDVIDLSTEQLNTLIKSYFHAASVDEVVPTEGGLANTNLRITLNTGGNPILLRLCVRDPQSGAKEYRLLQLVQGSVPVPRPIHFSTVNPVNSYPFMLLDWVEGSRLETVLDIVKHRGVAHLGESLGSTLAGIHRFKFEQAGFFDEDLEIAIPMEMSGQGLLRYAEECLVENIGGQRLGPELREHVLEFVKQHNQILDEWTGMPCLTHSDFNGSNILVKETNQGWEVAAVLDWEFAFSGTPFFDFGNLLRAPVGELPGMEAAIERGYKNAGGELPKEWRKMSKLSDLTAWMEFLTRENAGAQLISDAQAQIRKTIAEW